MSRNGSGVYSLPAGNPVVTGTTISSSWANTTLSDIATALTGSVAADGQTAMTGNLQMGNNKVTGLAVATTSGDALSYAQAATVSDLAVTGNATVGGTLTLTGGLTLNGNVTVGDSSSDTLTVNATSTFAAGATFSSTFAANGGVTLGDASGDALTINSSAVSIPNGLNFDSNTLVIDATNNRVGIGTASPGANLEISGTATEVAARVTGTTGAVFTKYGNTGQNFWVGLDNSSGSGFVGSAYAANLYASGAYPMVFSTNSSERMRIDSSGNVGIGTSSPTSYGSGYRTLAFNGTNGAVIDFNVNGTRTGSVFTDVSGGAGDGLNLQTRTALPILFTTNGDVRMTLNSSGNLGLGVTPSAWSSGYRVLQVGNGAGSDGSFASGSGITRIGTNTYRNTSLINTYISNGYATEHIQTNGQYQWFTAPSGTAGNAITFTQAMTLDASGNLGIGTSSPAGRLDIRGSNTVFRIASDTNDTGTIQFFNTVASSINATIAGNLEGGNNGGNITFSTKSTAGSLTERMRIDSSGNLLVGTTNTDPAGNNVTGVSIRSGVATSLQNGSSTALALGSSANNTYLQVFRNAGTLAGYISVPTSNTTTYNSVSDYRLKENPIPLENALGKIELLKPCTFTWKSDGTIGEGFIAHELQAVIPSAVAGEKDAVDSEGNMLPQGIDKSVIVPYLVKAIQELKAEVDSLKAQLNK